MNEKLKQLENEFKKVVISTNQMRYTFDKVDVDYEGNTVGIIFNSDSSLSITIWYEFIDEDNWNVQYDFSGVNQFFDSEDLNELKNITHNIVGYARAYLEEYKKDLGLVECVIKENTEDYPNSTISLEKIKKQLMDYLHEELGWFVEDISKESFDTCFDYYDDKSPVVKVTIDDNIAHTYIKLKSIETVDLATDTKGVLDAITSILDVYNYDYKVLSDSEIKIY